MIKSVDINPIFSGTLRETTGHGAQVAVRSLEDYEFWRGYFYGNLDPSKVLLPLEQEGVKPKATAKSKSNSKSRARLRAESKSLAQKVGSDLVRDSSDWLLEAKNLLLASGGNMTIGVVDKMSELLLGAYRSRNTVREKSQLAYMFRSLGISPKVFEEGEPILYGVVFEFDIGEGPTLMYSSSDGFSCMYWVGGGVKWASYEGGDGFDISQRLYRLGSEQLPQLLASVPVDDSLPSRPKLEYVRITYVTSRGLLTRLSKRSEFIESDPVTYRLFYTLFRSLLGGEDSSNLSPFSRNMGGSRSIHLPLPLKLLISSYGSVGRRAAALSLDIMFFVVLLGGFSYLLSPIVGSWDFVLKLLYVCFLVSAIPICCAWMESTPEWGYATFGKRLLGLRVHSVLNSDLSSGPTFEQSFARNTVKYFLSPLFFFVGFFWAAYHPFVRTWHDLLGDTVILNKDSKFD